MSRGITFSGKRKVEFITGAEYNTVDLEAGTVTELDCTAVDNSPQAINRCHKPCIKCRD